MKDEVNSIIMDDSKSIKEKINELKSSLVEYLDYNGYEENNVLSIIKKEDEYQVLLSGNNRAMTLDLFFEKYKERNRAEVIKKNMDKNRKVMIVDDIYAQPTYLDIKKEKDVISPGIGIETVKHKNPKNTKHFKGDIIRWQK